MYFYRKGKGRKMKAFKKYCAAALVAAAASVPFTAVQASDVSFPDVSYMFNTAFTDAARTARSFTINVTRDCYMRVSCFDDCDFALFRADGSLLLTKEQLKNVKVPVKAGEGYYVTAQSANRADTNIFIYAD